jgi:serine/threonine protein kinase
VIYAYEYHTLRAGCFYRDIKPGNILCKRTVLSNGNPDFQVLVGDFGLFTDGNEEQYGFSGTPNFMCFKNINDIEDQCVQLNLSKFDSSSIYDIGMFVNDTYAYICTLEYLVNDLNMKDLQNYITERKNNLSTSLNDNEINKKNFCDLFVINAPHPKKIVKYLLDITNKVSIKKINNPSQTVYANSFIADIALHELDRYLIKNNKKGILVNDKVSLYRPRGTEIGLELYLNLEGPFAYSYLFLLILNNISANDENKKDLNDYLYNFNPQSFKRLNNAKSHITFLPIRPHISRYNNNYINTNSK